MYYYCCFSLRELISNVFYSTVESKKAFNPLTEGMDLLEEQANPSCPDSH